MGDGKPANVPASRAIGASFTRMSMPERASPDRTVTAEACDGPNADG